MELANQPLQTDLRRYAAPAAERQSRYMDTVRVVFGRKSWQMSCFPYGVGMLHE